VVINGCHIAVESIAPRFRIVSPEQHSPLIALQETSDIYDDRYNLDILTLTLATHYVNMC
jgi:hypothetical protein